MANRNSYSKQKMIDALLSLIKIKPLSEIKDREIIKQAKVSSKTFYHYCENKTDLIWQVEDDYLDGFEQALKTDRAIFLKEYPKVSNLHEVVDFFAANKSIIKILVSENADERFFIKLRKIALREYIYLMKLQNGYHYDMHVGSNHYFVGRIYVSLMLAALLTWLQSSALIPKEKMITFYNQNWNNTILKKLLNLPKSSKNNI